MAREPNMRPPGWCDDTPLVTVIIAAYNAEGTVGAAVRSCLSQELRGLEVIVVDDGSKDRTAAVVGAIADPRVRLIRLERNVGPGAARNVALEAARGQWAAILDADDAFAPSRLAKLIAVAAREGPAAVVADRVRVGAFNDVGEFRPHYVCNSLPARRYRDGKAQVSGAELLERDIVIKPMVPLGIIRQHAVGYPSETRFGEDLLFMLRVLAVPGARLVQIPDVLYYYRLRPGSLSTSPTRQADLQRALLVAAADPDLCRWRRELIERAGRADGEHRYLALRNAVRRGDVRAATQLLIDHPRLAWTLVTRVPGSVCYRAGGRLLGVPPRG